MIINFKKSVLTALAATVGLASVAQDAAPNGWHLKDRASQGSYGVSLEKAYSFVKNKKSKTVIVAVIDSGIDTLHEDLKPVLWRNAKEIAGNGIDDDGNGYVDDIHGWNFIGGRDGRNVKEDSYEVARVYHKFKTRFATVTDPSTLSKEDQELYRMWKRAEKEIAPDPTELLNLMLIKGAYKEALKGDTVLKQLLNKEEYTGADVEAFKATTDEGKKAKERILRLYNGLGLELSKPAKGVYSEIAEYISGEERKAESADRAPQNYRAEIVKDNYNDFNDRFYGNNDIMANTPFHGTHVSGIIAAARKNGKGIDGIASDVRIMTIRAVPDGDEHDKDIALAIRYAVDNGAKIINMSFGKGFSPEKHWVDDAVKYADSKGVLIVHAAGNSAANIDTAYNFPTSTLLADRKRASNWIEVGASGDPKNGGLVASFSNYGKEQVDVFAPGHQIYSTVPGGNTYGNASGTSMASPVVAGVAAFLLSYYPELTPQQLKHAIEKGSVAPTAKVTAPDGKTVALSEISRTGGIVNAFEAAKIAETLTAKKLQPKPKTTIKNPKKS